MSKKPSNDQAADDWAGLAQNLFGINLGKGGDEDLLDDDMFKVDIPKPPEPPPVVLQSEVEFAPEAPVPPVAATAAPVQPVAKLPAKPPAARVAKPKPVEADSFGAGIDEDEALIEEVGLTFEEATAETNDDDGLTLPDDYDAEGLTLPADYDDGLTLAPEAAAVSQTSEDFDDDGDEEDEDASDTEVIPAPRGEKEGEGSSDTRRRRQPRRTREDAYWDMLENWEWEEIPDHDSPRSDGDRSRSSSRGDRGDRRGGGGRSRRSGSSRDDRPRSDDRSPAGERPVAETAGTASSGTDDRPQRPRRDDRPRDDRGRRDDRPRRERRPERDDRRRDEPRSSAPTQPTVAVANSSDDFGSGIYEAPVASAPAQTRQEPQKPRRSSEDAVAQTSRAADAVVRSDRGASNRPIEDDLVWPDDDSDVRSAPANSVVETSGLPTAETAGESHETVSESDVRPLDEDDEALRPRRRRRRRRGGPRSESSSAPPDGNEGTTFDLSDALDSDSETPDFIPSASAEDSASSDEFGAGVAASDSRESTGDEQSSEQRGRRRRRRRRRPSDGSAPESAEREDREPSDSDDADDVAESRNEEREEREERTVIKPITYSNIPSWEEAIKYLLQPNLVGRNLGPDDADESLENDPRGSGGAEPTPPPPQRRRSSGGGGRGRRR